MITTTNLDPALFQELVRVLTPFMTSDHDRQANLRLALPDVVYRQIQWAGAGQAFTVQMIHTLLQYGEIAPGKQALVAVLDVIHDQVGVNNQHKIDQVRQKLLRHLRVQVGLVACPHCGADNRTAAKFCVSCGQRLTLQAVPKGKLLHTLVFPVQQHLTPRTSIAIAGVVVMIALGWVVWWLAKDGTAAFSPPAAPTATTAAGSPTTLVAATPTTAPGVTAGATPVATPRATAGGSAPFVLFSGDPRSNNPPLCRGFQSQCNFAGCDAFVNLIEGPGCVEGDDDRIVPGLYEVTLAGSGLVLAGRMTNTDPLFPVPADGYNVTLSGSYTFCWPGWQSGAEPFGILAVTQTQLPNRVDHVEIRYVRTTCP